MPQTELGEPFNNLDPIVNYTVSCSGDDACLPISIQLKML